MFVAAPRGQPGQTRQEVARFLAEGLTRGAVARRLGISKPTVTYHATRLGLPTDERANRRYDWGEVQAYYDAGHSITQCQERFGFARCTFVAAARRGDVVTRPHGMPIAELLRGERNRTHVKVRLLRAGLLEDCCAECGLTEWRGAPIALELHHINGDGKDNRLENLAILCPNCHSQTDSWGGRNRQRAA